jgi:hypothetical protein
MKYTVVMGSGATIYMPSFTKIGSGIQKLLGGTQVHTHRQQDGLISLLLSLQNKVHRIKMLQGATKQESQ